MSCGTQTSQAAWAILMAFHSSVLPSLLVLLYCALL
jgi:hypothetical protein